LRAFGWHHEIGLLDGLERTADWYKGRL
jgi:nucleoside-diphosphate-sugar epimerase